MKTAAPFCAVPRIWQPVGSADISGTLIRQDTSAAIIRTADGRGRSLRIRRLGDEDLGYLANMRAVTHPFRNWSFHDDRGPQTFHTAYVQITGFDSPLTRQFVVRSIGPTMTPCETKPSSTPNATKPLSISPALGCQIRKRVSLSAA